MATQTRRLEADLFGRETDFEYSETWIGYAVVFLRIAMGWTLLQGGLTELVTYLDANPGNDWTAAGFLQHAIPEGNPFVGVWGAMAGDPLVDLLVMWGLTLTGLGLVLGALVRWNAFWGAVMMVVFWAASLVGGLMAGLPLAHGWVIDDHLVYVALLFGLGAIGAGRLLGLDDYIEAFEVGGVTLVERYPALRYLLGCDRLHGGPHHFVRRVGDSRGGFSGRLTDGFLSSSCDVFYARHQPVAVAAEPPRASALSTGPAGVRTRSGRGTPRPGS